VNFERATMEAKTKAYNLPPRQTCQKAVLKHPQSKRFARFGDARWSRQRLDCVRFTAAIPAGQLC
jgi:hypothetical protein